MIKIDKKTEVIIAYSGLSVEKKLVHNGVRWFENFLWLFGFENIRQYILNNIYFFPIRIYHQKQHKDTVKYVFLDITIL